MEELFVYLLKSSALIAAFFLSYHFLLRKETFFTSNRWFLLVGLLTSVLIPLFFIKKIIWVERPKVSAENLTTLANSTHLNTIETQQTLVESIDWLQLIAIGYGLVVSILILKVIFNVLSLFKLLHNKKIEKQERFAMVDLDQDIAPFSFFNFIVFNSSMYTPSEMESILLHEKVHSQQKHSFDVLIAKLFSVLFWFNPFIWLYKKAIMQNLEYIADSKAVALIEDKKVYQKALLKVVTHQNCLSITSPFYQSLIKKRIVMLNKNQSHKRNSWKYTVVIPALIVFIVFFQVKIIAQEIALSKTETTTSNSDAIYVTINKNSTDAEMKRSTELLKDQYGIKLKFSKVKRNASGEITGIKVEFNDKKGNSGVQQFNGNEPIKPIHFYKNDNKIGFGKSGESKVYAYTSNGTAKKVIITDSEAPEAPEAPESPEAPEAVEIIGDFETLAPLEELDEIAPLSGQGANSRVYIHSDNEKPIVIVDGKVIKGGEKLSKKELKALKGAGKSYVYSYSGQNGMNEDEIIRIKTDALNNARISMRKMGPEIRAQVRKEMEKSKIEMGKARIEMERARPNMEKARQDMERSRPEIEKARAEMMQAKEEMIQAKKEMEQAKAELEQAKAAAKDKK